MKYKNYYESKKYWEYPKVDRICIVNKHKVVYKSNKNPKYNIPGIERKGIKSLKLTLYISDI